MLPPRLPVWAEITSQDSCVGHGCTFGVGLGPKWTPKPAHSSVFDNSVSKLRLKAINSGSEIMGFKKSYFLVFKKSIPFNPFGQSI